jgi:DNA-binding CsgD family transcriptional regulator
VLDSAKAGSGRLVAIEAAAGLGKTRLLEATLDQAREREFLTFRARGSELEREFPFGVVRQLFEPVLAGMPPARRDALFAGAARFARPLFFPHEDGGQWATDSSFQALYGIYWVLQGLGAKRPLAVGVDDAQWADSPSLRFLAFLAARLDGLPLGLVITARPPERQGENTVLERIVEAPQERPLSPQPLSDDAVAELCATELAGEPDPAFARACRRASGGNPFFLRALLRELSDGNVEPSAAEAARVVRVTPRAVSHAVLMRLSALPPAAARLTKAVAILGDGVELPHAAALEDLERSTAAEAADLLAGAAILKPSRGLEFTHPIIRDAVYAELAVHERAEAHARAARLLMDAEAPAQRIASQLLEAPPAADERAVNALCTAAQEARTQGAPEVAAEYLRRALAEPPPAPRRASILLDLGSAAALAGQPDAADRLEAALEITPDPDTKLRAAAELGQVLTYASRADRAPAVVRRTVEELEPPQKQGLELTLLVMAQIMLGPREMARDLIERASRAVEHGGADAPRWLLGLVAIQRAIADGTAQDAVRISEWAIASQRGVEATIDTPHPYFIAAALALADRIELGERHLTEIIDAAQERGSVRQFASASAMRAWVRFRRGGLADAEVDALAYLDLGQGHEWEFFGPIALAALVDVRREHGNLQGAEEALGLLDPERQITDSVLYQQLRMSRVRLRLAQGRPRDALTDIEDCARWQREWRARNSAWVPWRTFAALARVQLGEREEARRLADEELSLAEGFGAARGIGIALRARGLAAEKEESVELLGRAVSVLETSPARLEHARALADLGAALRRSNRRSDARPPLRQALDIAHGLGATALAEHVEIELAATGARARRVVRRGVDELTPSERRVARMAADGMSNPEIAQALFVTLKTVETHLSGTYRKLGIGSRSELAAAMN